MDERHVWIISAGEEAGEVSVYSMMVLDQRTCWSLARNSFGLAARIASGLESTD
jgi:hypothetical protein